MKVAIVSDWLTIYGGAEKCIESFNNIFPSADNFALVDFLNRKERDIILKGKECKTSFLQKIPFSKNTFRNFLFLFPLAIENFDLREYDLILSSSHSVAKNVLRNSKQIHICYCHTPMRYAWDMYFDYMKNEGILKKAILKYVLHKLRLWDAVSTNRVDFFIANSNYVKNRIKKIYNRNATVIYPPVDIDKFETFEKKDNFYLTISRLIPYKKVDLIVKAFSKMKDKKLVVIGNGSELNKIKKIATPNVEILGYQSFDKVKDYLQRAKAFIFAAEEDFGIVNVEAQACGTPVIAYGIGGAGETVINNETGILFYKQDVNSIIEAVNKFEKSINKFDVSKIRKNAERFSRDRFEKEIKDFINSHV